MFREYGDLGVGETTIEVCRPALGPINRAASSDVFDPDYCAVTTDEPILLEWMFTADMR